MSRKIGFLQLGGQRDHRHDPGMQIGRIVAHNKSRTASILNACPRMAPQLHKPDITTLRNAVEMLFFRSEEHTSALQSRFDLVCRLLLEKKKTSGHGLGRVPIVWTELWFWALAT